MGCASSKTDINDQHPNMFQVMNVDDQFRPISPGQIEVTDTELIFYQRSKKPTTWSLRNLRKYGFDSEIFTFECGRRCATGEGIFAFKCKKAEQLFNLLQHNINVRNMSEEDHESQMLANQHSQQIQQIQMNQQQIQQPNQSNLQNQQNQRDVPNQRQVSIPEGYLRPALSRPGSITSNGPLPATPTTPTPLPTIPPTINNVNHENNNNEDTAEHTYLNAEVINQVKQELGLNHAIHVQNAPQGQGQGHQYSNVNLPTKEEIIKVFKSQIYYANVKSASPNSCVCQTDSEPSTEVNNKDNNLDEEDEEENVVESVILPQLPTNKHGGNHHGNIHNLTSTLTLNSIDASQGRDDHCYANIDPSRLQSEGIDSFEERVNYAELDLPSSTTTSLSSRSAKLLKQRPLSGDDSPVMNKGKPYVTIDFKKTDALSQSINPRLELDEAGCRKTRHNSTIGDIRHSSSISD